MINIQLLFPLLNADSEGKLANADELFGYRNVFEALDSHKNKTAKINGDWTATKKSLVLALCAIVLCTAVAVPLLLYTAPPSDPMENAITRAINAIKGTREPHALLMLDVIYRRFGITEFADATQRYDQEIAARPDEAPVLRVLRRIIDHDNPLQAGDLQAVTAETDVITVPALYCDREPLTLNYPQMLYSTAIQGDYMLTHVLLAFIWIQENGYEVPLSSAFIEDVYTATAALIYDDSLVTDLELEAAVFLYLAGQGARVKDSFTDRIIAAQNYDGGWLRFSDESGVSYWHATVLGLMFLLHVQYPADSYPPMLAPASP